MFFPSETALRRAFERRYVTPLGFSFHSRKRPEEIYGQFADRSNTVFLDSARSHPKTGRHSYIAWDPYLSFQSAGRQIVLDDLRLPGEGPPLPKLLEGRKRRILQGHPLEELRKIFQEHGSPAFKGLPPFLGGAIGYLGYDLVHQFEHLPRKAKADDHLPETHFLFFRDVLVYHHFERRYTLFTHLFPGEEQGFREAYEKAQARLFVLRETIGKDTEVSPNGVSKISHFCSSLSREAFIEAVLKAKAYIRAGDIYQANLSQRFSFDYQGDAYRLYLRLRQINPSPFAAFLNLGRLKILSASPERLIRLRGGLCETRPIAGTRPRGRSAAQTRRLSRELILSEKERAEHLMLLDLERNDLGRVCNYHTVRVSERMVLEKYSHVIHIVSNVVGRLAQGKDRFDLIRALFPGGTITGCPKIRCMEIIDELEPVRRGLYTGSIGYLAFNGDMDFNIVIRTLILNGRKGMIHVGAGIVHDSIPEKEYEETLHKGAALLEALGVGQVS